MKKLIAVLSLLALPALAHAKGDLTRLPSVRKQLTEMAQKQGLMHRGSGDRLIIKEPKFGAGGEIEAEIKGIGGMTGSQKVTKAVGSFKFAQEPDGRMVEEGQEFAVREFLKAN
jgi:hypothetical protein